MGKNQHYVPKFYLKLFSDNLKSIGTWYAEADKVILNASISNMASRDNLYGSNQELEECLALLEREWSITINNIIETNKILSEDDLVSILTFITIGYSRTLKTADANNYLSDFLVKKALAEKIPKNVLDNIKIEMNIPNLNPIQIAAELTTVLFDLSYFVIDNTSSMPFITSDNPICCYNKLYVHRRYNRNYGFGTAGLIIIVPLSPQKCICFYDSMVYRTISENLIVLDATNDILDINRLIARNAYHNLFFDNQKINCINDVKRAYRKTSIEHSVETYGPLFRFSRDSILDKFNLDFLKIRKKYKKVTLPAHMGGLLRPLARCYKIENYDKFYGK